MKFKFEYAVGGLLLLVFTIALLNLGYVREPYSQHAAPGALTEAERIMFENMVRDFQTTGFPAQPICVNGCVAKLDINNSLACVKYDETTKKDIKCPADTKCPSFAAKNADGTCMTCGHQSLLKLVGNKCLPKDPSDTPAFPTERPPPCNGLNEFLGRCYRECNPPKRFYKGFCTSMDIKKLEEDEAKIDTPLEPIGCPTGCTQAGMGCIKSEVGHCLNFQNAEEPICKEFMNNPSSKMCDSKQCSAGQFISGADVPGGLCAKNCPAGKTLDLEGKACILKQSGVAEQTDVTTKKSDKKNYAIYGVIAVVAVVVIVAIMLMASPRPAGGKRRSR